MEIQSSAKTSSRSACLLILSAACLLAGCGESGPKPVAVKGKVIYDGRPLESGTVMFIPDAPGPYATGDIQADGTYALQILPGGYHIAVSAVAYPGGLESAAEPLVPAKYGSEKSSGLVAEIKPAAENTVDLVLEAEQKAGKKKQG